MGSLFGTKQKTTTSSDPYGKDYKPQVSDYYSRVLDKVDSPVSAYGGTVNASQNQTQYGAINNLNNLTGTAALQDTINGRYLDPESNPYLQKYFDKASQNINEQYGKTTDAYDSKFGSNSFWGGSQHQKAYQEMADNKTDAMNDLATSIYGGAYNQERANQMNAINQAGNLYSNAYNLGQSQYGNEQNALDNLYKEWLRQQQQGDSDLDRYAQYLSLVKSPQQTSTTTSTPGLGSVIGSFLGK